MTDAKSKSLKWDLLASYAAAAARVISWAVVFALVYRYDSPESAGLLIAARSILAFVPVAMLNIPTAFLWRLSIPVAEKASDAATEEAGGPKTLAYANLSLFQRELDETVQRFLHAVRVIGVMAALVGLTILFFWAIGADEIKPIHAWSTLLYLGLGVLIRTISDLAGVLIHRHGYLAVDQLLQGVADVAWVITATLMLGSTRPQQFLTNTISIWLLFSLGPAIFRAFFAQKIIRMASRKTVDFSLSEFVILTKYGATVSFGQLADLMYAPLALVIMTVLALSQEMVLYGVLLQIDAAMLLAVGAIGAVMTPRMSLMLSAGNIDEARKTIWRATMAAVGLLGLISAILLVMHYPLLKLWLGKMPTGILIVLPVFLLHTVVGGASGVMRSFLLISGQSKAVMTSALIAGVCNAAGVAGVLMLTNWGLFGVACVTAVCVMARCGVWMPWYTNKTLRKLAADGAKIETDSNGEIAAEGVIALPQEARGLP
jgi:O-antigen/teichoic acid export membrane protein